MTEAREGIPGGGPGEGLGWGSTENVPRLLGLLWGEGEKLESPWVASNFPVEEESSLGEETDCVQRASEGLSYMQNTTCNSDGCGQGARVAPGRRSSAPLP